MRRSCAPEEDSFNNTVPPLVAADVTWSLGSGVADSLIFTSSPTDICSGLKERE